MKRDLETSILGAIILNGNCGTVAEAMQFLTFKNFGTYADFDNKTLFKCICEMYPNQSIDLLTVAAEMKLKYKINCNIYLSNLTNRIASTTHVISHCAYLLQLDLTEKFCKLLNDLSANNVIPIEERLLIANCEKEILESGLDILDAIPAFIKMAQIKNISKLAITHAEKFNDSVNAKCSNIRQAQKKHAILAHLKHLCKTPKANELLTLLTAEL